MRLPDRLSGPAGRRSRSCARSWRSTPGGATRSPSSSSASSALRGAPGCPTTCSRSPGRSSASSCTASTASASRRTRSAATARSPRPCATRDGYFPAGADVFVVHPPTGARTGSHRRARALPVHGQPARRRQARSTCWSGRWRHVARDVELRDRRHRAGRGGAARAGGRRPAGSASAGACRARELAELYAGARAVAFVPYEEDYGLVTLEAMLRRQAGHHRAPTRAGRRSWSRTA